MVKFSRLIFSFILAVVLPLTIYLYVRPFELLLFPDCLRKGTTIISGCLPVWERFILQPILAGIVAFFALIVSTMIADASDRNMSARAIALTYSAVSFFVAFASVFIDGGTRGADAICLFETAAVISVGSVGGNFLMQRRVAAISSDNRLE